MEEKKDQGVPVAAQPSLTTGLADARSAKTPDQALSITNAPAHKTGPPPRYCFNCAQPVGEQDFDYVGNHRLFCCGESDCGRALRDEHRQFEDEARDRAADDNYSAYW